MFLAQQRSVLHGHEAVKMLRLRAGAEHCSRREVRACGRNSSREESRPYILEAEVLDDYEAAEMRLQKLLNTEEESIERESLQIPEPSMAVDRCSRRLIFCVAASFLGAYVCQLLNQPLSGIGAASFGDHAAHLASGIALASPIAVIKWLSWSPAVHEELPSIEAMHNSYEKNVPEMGALSLFQALLYYPAEIIRDTIYQVPVLQACLFALFTGYAAKLTDWNWWVPESLPAVAAVIVSAGLAGYMKLAHYSPPADQYVTVQDAVDNSDLYYKLLSSAIGQRSRDAAKMSNAFKQTAEAWLAESLGSAILTAIFASLEIVLISGLWQGTHDITAPLSAAILIYGADTLAAYKSIQGKLQNE